MNPLPVTVVRPQMSAGSAIGFLVSAALNVVIRALLLMAAARIVGFPPVSFRDAFVLSVAIRALFGDEETAYKIWTRAK